MREVYGEYLNDFLDSIRKPNPRLYVRVNTLKTSVEKILEKLLHFKPDEDFKEAIYTEIRGPNEIEIHENKVIVDKKTAESVMLGANVYKPGLKRVLINDPKEKRVTVYSDNGFPVAEGKYYGINTDLVVEVTRSLYTSPKLADLPELKNGLVYVQGKASMYVAHLLDPQPNEKIVDMTAYPGGKLTHIYQLEPRVKLIGFDHTENKVKKLRDLVNKMGMRIEIYKADSRYLYEDYNIREIDKVIIDPPCSALGIRPKLYDKKTKQDILNFHKYQKQFLNSAYKILKKNGVVLYSTCTVTTWENEKVIDDPRFSVEYEIRFHPHIHEITGFFIAKLIKKG
ncbi:SAM-dependent methyltransferase [Sulfolobus sp. E5-1-F]|uniref:RsmB/NOP family class I SAM-dependent RNA methyltransferase n=1 Tax=Saccharolobus sp. E5-1-F TaxID=2663019 RepID=UPI00129622C9|nr:RsmB/NOP family class I SAM-dependent RNA methyltransferase [Sulfolobus sp. E5-1-F]QGA54834.1 SAM-dependent methyltransferase [Sulfolobus sp. E5-1-F]